MTALEDFSSKHLPVVEQEMLDFLAEHTSDARLAESMSYSIQAGGKRMRPQLLLATADAFQSKINKGVYQTAAALEMIHTYSLIHDDLPAMDDDELRRGKPTNHMVYGAGMATLAGDGLLTLAFQLLSNVALPDEQKIILLQHLSKAAGTEGMAAGQAADIQGEGQHLTLEELMAIHERKTGALIGFAIFAGGYLAKQPESVLAILQRFAQHLGLAFQIRDDLLDVTSTKEQLGKNVGRDAQLAKNTYPALLGVTGATEALEKELQAAKECLREIKEQAVDFSEELLLEIIAKFHLPQRK